jgi:hypothetical protein
MPLTDDVRLRRLCRARDVLAASYAGPVTLDRCSFRGVSLAFRFQGLLAGMFGESPHHFVTRRRLDAAQQFLAAGGLRAPGSAPRSAPPGRVRQRRECQLAFRGPNRPIALASPDCYAAFFGKRRIEEAPGTERGYGFPIFNAFRTAGCTLPVRTPPARFYVNQLSLELENGRGRRRVPAAHGRANLISNRFG